MRDKVLVLFALINCAFCFSQNEILIAKSGIITMASNQKVSFNNLRLRTTKFAFFDVETNNEKEISTNTVKYIEDEKMSRVFSNKKVLDSTQKIDLKEKEIQKQIDYEKRTKLAEEKKKAEEEESKRIAFNHYPPGIYNTKEDFLKKQPNAIVTIVPQGFEGVEKPASQYTPDNCFFNFADTDKKVKNVFAVSYRGCLYFQIGAILKNKNKTDRAQDNDQPNRFVKVLSGGENYYYTEADLGNIWAQGVGYGVGGVAGGIIAANGMPQPKGLVWDIKNKEFNIFKNCKDYNEFIKTIDPIGIQECINQQPNLNAIRLAIERIK